MLGFVNLFKPAGPSSAQMVARLRRIYGQLAQDRRLPVGHLGTLDPQAAGVLPIALGKATRLIPLLNDRRKVYVCTLVAGRSTTTGDASGETRRVCDVPPDWASRLPVLFERFTGAIEQTAPMYSAVHHEGKRLYQLARAGKVDVRKTRTVTVYGITLLGVNGNTARLRIACGEGMYVRTLCEDLAAALGLAAHMGALVREASGPFVLYESVRLEEDLIADPLAKIISPENVIPFPTVVLDLRGAADFRAGRTIPLPSGHGSKHVFVRDGGRRLVGVGETLGALLAPRKVFV